MWDEASGERARCRSSRPDALFVQGAAQNAAERETAGLGHGLPSLPKFTADGAARGFAGRASVSSPQDRLDAYDLPSKVTELRHLVRSHADEIANAGRDEGGAHKLTEQVETAADRLLVLAGSTDPNIVAYEVMSATSTALGFLIASLRGFEPTDQADVALPDGLEIYSQLNDLSLALMRWPVAALGDGADRGVAAAFRAEFEVGINLLRARLVQVGAQVERAEKDQEELATLLVAHKASLQAAVEEEAATRMRVDATIAEFERMFGEYESAGPAKLVEELTRRTEDREALRDRSSKQAKVIIDATEQRRGGRAGSGGSAAPSPSAPHRADVANRRTPGAQPDRARTARRRGTSQAPATGRVVLVAGATGTGKSTLIEQMVDGTSGRNLPAGLPAVRGWDQTTAVLLDWPRHPAPDAAAAATDMLLHLDISQLLLPGDVRRRRIARVSRFLAAARELHVLTLWAPHHVLLARIDRRIDERTRRRPNGRRSVARRSLMEDDEGLTAIYRTWFDLLARFTLQSNWVVESSSPTGAIEATSIWAARNLHASTGHGVDRLKYATSH